MKTTENKEAKVKKILSSIALTIILLMSIMLIVRENLVITRKEGDNSQKVDITKLEKQEILGSEDEIKIYNAYIIINESTVGSDANIGGSKLQITSNSEVELSYYDAVTDAKIESEIEGTVIVPQHGLKLKIDGIIKGSKNEIKIESKETPKSYKSELKKAIIEVDATIENEVSCKIKEITKIENGKEVTEEGSKENVAVMMYEENDGKVKLHGNNEVEIYYYVSDKNGKSEEELGKVDWSKYNREEGLGIEKNGIIYTKSKYKDGKYSKITSLNINNIDKLNPTLEVKSIEENDTKDEAKIKIKIQDQEETEEYGKSGIKGYALTTTEEEPAGYVETNEEEIEIGGITDNGTYYLWVSDEAENVIHQSVEVNNITYEQEDIVAIILQAEDESLIGTEYKTLKALTDKLEESEMTAEKDAVVVQIVNNIKNESLKINNKNIILDLNGYTITNRLQEATIDVQSGKIIIVDNKYDIEEQIEDATIANTLKNKYHSNNESGKIYNPHYIAIELKIEGKLTIGEDHTTGYNNIEYPDHNTPVIEGEKKGILNYGGEFNYYDGVIYGKMTIDGKVTNTPLLYDPAGEQEEERVKTTLEKVSEIEAMIGKTRYVKLETAIMAANDLKGTPDEQVEIDIVKNITKNQVINVSEEKNIKLDLNGYTLISNGEDYVINNEGKLEIIDSTIDEESEESEENVIVGKIKTSAQKAIHNSSSGKLTIVSGQVECNDGQAIENEGDTVILKGIILGEVYSYSGQIELNGGTISAETGIYNMGTGKISIIEGTINGGEYGIYNKNDGTIELKGGTISTYDSSGSTGIYNNNNGTVELSGGTIKASASYYSSSNGIINYKAGTIKLKGGNISATYGIYNSSDGTIEVSDGNISATYGIYNGNQGTIYVNGGTISATNGVTNKKAGYIEINESNITNSRYGITNESTGTIKITGINIDSTSSYDSSGIYNKGTGTIIIGKKDGIIENDKINIKAKTNSTSSGGYGVNNSNNGEILIYEGTIIGKDGAIYGVVKETETDYAMLLENTEEGEKLTIGEQRGVAYIGEEKNVLYDTIKSALDACNENDIITLIKNSTMADNERLLIEENKNITIDLNGNTITSFTKNIFNKGNLTIKDTSEGEQGKIKGYSESEKGLFDNANNLTIENGTIETLGQFIPAIYNEDSGDTTINGGKIIVTELYLSSSYSEAIINEGSGRVEINNGYIEGKTGIINKNSGTVEIKGGEIKSTTGIENDENGTVDIEGGTIEGSLYSIYNNNGTMNIKGGTIIVLYYGIYNCGTGIVEMTGGILTTPETTISNATGIYNLGSGNIKIKGGTIDIVSSAYSYGIRNNGYVEITEGKITAIHTNVSSSYAISYGILNEDSGNVLIGNEDGEVNVEKIKIKGRKFGVSNKKGKLEFYDGIIEGLVDSSIEGVISDYEDKYTLVVYKYGETDNYEITEGYEIRVLEKVYVAHVESNNTDYLDIYEAIESLSNKDKLTILCDISENQEYGALTFGKEKEIILDLNGNKLIGGIEKLIDNRGKLSIINSKEEGKIQSTNGIALYNCGELNLENIAIELYGMTYGIYNENSGKVKIIEGSINSKEPRLSKSAIISPIYNKDNGKIEINGTNITGDTLYSELPRYGIYNKDLGTIEVDGGSIFVATLSSYSAGYSYSYGIYSESSGAVRVDNCNITTSSEGTSVGICNNDTGTTEVRGGQITSSSRYSSNYETGIYNKGNGAVRVSGGKFKAREGIKNQGTGSVLLSGGEITGTYGINNQGTGTVEVIGGKITGSTYGINNNSTGKIIIGKKDGIVENDNINITSTSKYGICLSGDGELLLYDGTIIGKNEAISGVIKETEEENAIILESTEEGEKASIGKQRGIAYVGEETTVLYNSINEAIEACNGNGTITLIKDSTIIDSDRLTIEQNETIRINLNGQTIKMYTKELINEGELTIKDVSAEESGKIIGHYSSNIDNGMIKNSNNLTIESGTIENIGNNIISVYNIGTGNVRIMGGTIKVTSLNLSITSKDSEYAIYNDGTGDVEIKDGTIMTSSNSNSYSYSIFNNNTGKIKVSGGIITSADYGIYNNSTGNIEASNVNITSADSGIYNNSTGNIEASNVRITSSKYGMYNKENGSIRLENGNVMVSSTNLGLCGIYNNSYGNIEILDTNITSNGRSSLYGIYNSRGTIKLSNTDLTVTSYSTSSSSSIYGLYNYGTAEIIDGNITTTSSGSGTTNGIYNVGLLKLGELDSTAPSTEYPNITATSKSNDAIGLRNTNNGKVYFYDGIIKGSKEAISGIITDTPEHYKMQLLDGEKTAILVIDADFERIIEVNGLFYDSLQSAIDSITNSTSKKGTITIWDDIRNLGESTSIPEGIEVTIALEGHALLYEDIETAITNNGTLTIVDFEDISNSDEETLSVIRNLSGKVIQNNGTLVIGQTGNKNNNSPKIEGKPAVGGKEAEIKSGSTENLLSSSSVESANTGLLNKLLNIIGIKKRNILGGLGEELARILSSEVEIVAEPSLPDWTNREVQTELNSSAYGILNMYLSEVEENLSYTVNYYKKGTTEKVAESKTSEANQAYGTLINADDEEIEIYGYKVSGHSAESITIGEGENELNIYYEIDETKTKEVSYTVEYYKDNVKQNNDTEIKKENIQVLEDAVISIDRSLITNSSKYTGYKIEKIEPTEVGDVVNSGTVIRVYYVPKSDYSYTVNYYKKGTTEKVAESKTSEANQTYGTTINAEDEEIEVRGYKVSGHSEESITIGEGENELNIYYEIDETKTKELIYTVEYYKDNEKQNEDTETRKEMVQELAENKITIDRNLITNNNKYTGYKIEKTEPAEVPDKVNNKTVIKVYYIPRSDYSYIVNYYKKNTTDKLTESKTVDNATYGAVINARDEEKTIRGYKVVGHNVESITIGQGEREINIYYDVENEQTREISYTVEYYKNNQKQEDDTVVRKERVGLNEPTTMIFDRSLITNNDKYAGYSLERTNPESIGNTVDNGTVIKVYYTPRDDYSYTVYYYKQGTTEKIAESKTVENQFYGTTVNANMEEIKIEGYKVVGYSSKSIRIGEEEVLIIYYDVEDKEIEISYTVEYYKGNKKQDKDTVVITKKIKENEAKNLVLDKDLITNNDKYEGYCIEKTEPEEIGDLVSDGDVIKVYYVKTEEDNIISKDILPKTGQLLRQIPIEIIIALALIGAISYMKYYRLTRTKLCYKVNYYYKDLSKKIAESKVVENQKYGTLVNAKDEEKEIEGYKVVGHNVESIKLGKEENILNIYYDSETNKNQKQDK